MRPVVLACVAASTCACGRLSFDARGDGAVASGDTPTDVVDIDAMLSDFSAPSPITELNGTGFDGDASITADLREIYFSSNRAPTNNKDIWFATRATPTAAWQAPQLIPEIATAFDESGAFISGDALTLWFHSERAGNRDLFVSTRSTRSSSWSAPVALDSLNDPSTADSSMSVLPSGLVAYFCSQRAGSYDIYRTTRATTTDAWTAPVPVPEINTAANDLNPWLSSDEKVLFFNSDRLGDNDLYVATRASTAVPFGPATPLANINTPSWDADPMLYAGMHQLIFSSDRNGVVFDLYEASR